MPEIISLVDTPNGETYFYRMISREEALAWELEMSQ